MTKDPSIWSVLDLREFKHSLNLDDLKRIISIYGSESAKELLVCGNYTFDYVPMETLTINESQRNAKKIKIDRIDSDLINYLIVKCPNLSLISLEYLNLSSIQFHNFLHLKNLQTFSLRWCNIESNWFKQNETTVEVIKSYFYLTNRNSLVWYPCIKAQNFKL